MDEKRKKSIERRIDSLVDTFDSEELAYYLKLLLEKSYSLTLPSNTSVVHDDCDGDRSQILALMTGLDGDMYIKTNHPYGYLRFRMPFLGGGLSPHVWAALRILALAVEFDKRE